MVRFVRFMFFCSMLALSGCATAMLWHENSGEEFVEIVPKRSGEDVEFDLKGDGREYYCRQPDSFNYADKICYAKLTKEDKIKRIQVKFLKTPETLAIDAFQTIVVVGYVALESLARSGYHRE